MVPTPHGLNLEIKQVPGVRKSVLSPILEIFERLSILNLKWSVNDHFFVELLYTYSFIMHSDHYTFEAVSSYRIFLDHLQQGEKWQIIYPIY